MATVPPQIWHEVGGHKVVQEDDTEAVERATFQGGLND
jgi:hypothetical protein